MAKIGLLLGGLMGLMGLKEVAAVTTTHCPTRVFMKRKSKKKRKKVRKRGCRRLVILDNVVLR
jgi:hypothetical protein